MSDGHRIAQIAGLVGDPARAEMLTSLLGGQALTATELARVAGITKQTASAHLAKLLNAKLIEVRSQGRHRYCQLADDDVAHLLETIMGIARRAGPVRTPSSPKDPALRDARMCYGHLAGDKGVRVFDSLMQRRYLESGSGSLRMTREGESFFREFGIDLEALHRNRRALCRQCLDWSARRHHLAGALGDAVLSRIFAMGWARRAKNSRAVVFTSAGAAGLRRHFIADERPRSQSPHLDR